jgi:CBS domain-containing protein
MLDSTGNHKRTSTPSGFAAACVATAFRAAQQAPGARSDATMHCGSSTRREHQMNVRDGMTTVVLSIGPAHTLREAARLMSAQRVGAAVVVDPEQAGIGILTERDILDSVGAGQDPDAEMVADHRTSDVVFASPEWTLEQAAASMSAGNFRHLIVLEHQDVAGLLSMRDIVRCWAGAGVTASASL